MTASDPAQRDAAARAALAGRREQALLDEPSVAAAARVLVQVCRRPEPWVRAAVATLDRFSREVASGDLPGLLAAGRADLDAARRSLQQLALRHDGLAGSQMASLAFGPKLWWTVNGVPVSWRPLADAATATPPLPGRDVDPDLRLLLLAVLGSGATEQELRDVPAGAAGRLDAAGELVPDLDAEPLAVRYAPAEGGPPRVTFLSWEARAALQARWLEHGRPAPDDPLLLEPEAGAAAASGLRSTSAALIEAGNDVNVTLCRATGDFFRSWGMPGARFDEERSAQGLAELQAAAPGSLLSAGAEPDDVVPARARPAPGSSSASTPHPTSEEDL